MVVEGSGAGLLSGARGRRACAELAMRVDERLRDPLMRAAWSPGDVGLRRALLSALGGIDASAVRVITDPIAVLESLADSVTRAMYWQEPDEVDLLLASDELEAALTPVAQALTGAPAAAWWPSAVAMETQHCVCWANDGAPDAPELGRAADTLHRWKAATLAEEHRARERPEDPSAPWSGSWWSAPLGRPSALSTSRALHRLGPVGLVLVEDAQGWTDAQVWPMAPEPCARIYEITGSAAWTALVQRYPLEVTRSRRHDWWRVTGRPGTWHIPDWERVAADYDGVHLTVSGYLSTAGRALDVGDTATLLAGWNPDQTFWLTDVLGIAGRPQSWHWHDRDDLAGWAPGGIR